MKITNSKALLITVIAAVALAGCSMTSKNIAAAPKPVPIAAASEPLPTKVMAAEPVYVIEDVNFDFDKSTLKPNATSTLDQVVTELLKQSPVPYEIIGFTDSTGSDVYNQGLSERRSAAVQDYLIAHSVAASRLTMRGLGETNPVASNETTFGRAQNRRVEIRRRN